MTAGRYSFIDIAVLEEVRVEFAAGKALVLLSVDLDEVLWANGAGAALFGHGDVESVMGASPDLGFVARRQIAAVPGFPRMGRDRPVTIRLARGSASRAVPFSVSAVTLPDGVPAVLLVTMPDNDDDAAARIVTGFKEAGYFAALIDSQAQIQAMSDGFAALGILQDTLERLVAEVAHEHDRLVKRLIPARNGLIPAGIARLVDDPSLHLMIAVDEPIEEVAPTDEEDAPSSMETSRPVSKLAAPSDADLPERITENDSDDWYFDRTDEPVIAGDEADAIAPSAIAPSTHAPLDLASGPVRFSWRTDARGIISALSSEFIDAIGPDTANVVGQPLHQVIVKFSLDPQDEIATLLERRDTWSGRTVMWPVSGTKLVVPVDLAALPVYDRDRVFEGFRGFGVVRMGDATSDPHERGLNADKPSGQLFSDEAPVDVVATDSDSLEAPTDPFRNEAPAITVTQQANRRISDRVIQLAEHRPPQPDTPPQPDMPSQPDRPDELTPFPKHRLSAVERSAFEEIRERLQRETSAATRIEPEASQKEAQTGDEAAGKAAPVPASVDDRQEPVVLPVAMDGETPEAIEPDNDAPPQLEHDDNAGRTIIAPEVIAALPLPLLVHAGDVLHFANHAFFELTGYAGLDEIVQEGGLDRLFVEEPSQEPGETEGHKLWLRTSDGETFPVEAHLQSIGWQDGTALLLALQRVAVPALQPVPAPELTDDELAGDEPGSLPGELEQQLAELRTIIDTATDGVVLIAPDGTIRNISHPAEALFGFDSAEVEGSHFVTLLAIESRKTAREYLASLAENGVASLLNDGREVIGREREGRFIPLFMTIGRLPGDSGYCAVVRDITHFKHAEEEMTQARAQAERASLQKSEFLARVSHEIRTPLNAIIGFSELMMDEKFGPIGSDRYRDYLRDINRSGNHVLDLVNDLLDISKIEAGEQEMNYEAVSLNEALAEVVAMMQPQANRERVIIRSSLASSLPDIVADLRSVRQIALNLLSNAIRYTHAGGQVIVSTAYEFNGEVTLRVRDTGIGMTLAEIDQALKPFKQINALKRGRHDGTGLGLPLTRAMVEANRARFAISSTPGEGTLVEIVFPSTRVLAG